MKQNRFIISQIALLLLFGVLNAAGDNFEGSAEEQQRLSLRRLDSNEKKNLRQNKIDNDSGISAGVVDFEEDEKLWERILQQDLSITFPPATFPPTPPPLTLPIIEEDEECELMVNIECVEVEGDARIPCNQVPEPEDDDECVRDVQYVYRVTNSCDPSINPNCDDASIRTFDIVRNGVLKSLLSLVPENSRIAPSETSFFIEDNLEFDFCVNATVDTSARVIADTAPGMEVGICSAEGSNFFTIGFVPDFPCMVAIDLTCFIENGDERVNCKDIPMPEDDDECIKEVVYATIVTNIGDTDKAILSLKRTRDGDTADLIGLLGQRDLAPGEFAVAREDGQVLDFCVQRLVTTTVEVNSEAFGVGELECMEEATLVFSIAITCDVSVTAECFADPSRDFSVPCSDFNPFESESLLVGCEHVQKYVYTIENTGPGDEVIESVVVIRDGVSENILDRRFNLDPDEIREVNEFQLVDYCQDYPNGITTEVEVSADMIPLGGSCFDNDVVTVFPPMEECNVALNPFIKCTVEAPDGSQQLCSIYHESITDVDNTEQCIREVSFEYTLVNEGRACLLIYSVSGEIDNEGSFDLTPPGGRTLCPEESLILEQTQTEDFCDEDLQDRVEVIVNDGPPETCGGFGALGFFPPEEEAECTIELDLSCTSSSGGDCVLQSQDTSTTKQTGYSYGALTVSGYRSAKKHITYGKKEITYGQHESTYGQHENTNGQHEVASGGDSKALDEQYEFTYNISNRGETDAFLKEIVFTIDDTQITAVDLSGTIVQVGRSFTGTETLDLSSITASSTVSATTVADSPAEFECRANNAVDVGFKKQTFLQKVECLSCPNTFIFKFNCKTCLQSTNSQDILCTDNAPIPDSARILITDTKHVFFEGEVSRGDIFEVEAGEASFKTDIVVKVIQNDHVIQIMKFHASCDKPIFLGDVFGSLQVVGWENRKQGRIEL